MPPETLGRRSSIERRRLTPETWYTSHGLSIDNDQQLPTALIYTPSEFVTPTYSNERATTVDKKHLEINLPITS